MYIRSHEINDSVSYLSVNIHHKLHKIWQRFCAKLAAWDQNSTSQFFGR